MKVTDIQLQQHNQNRFSVFVDGSFAFSLALDEIQDNQIRLGMELSKPELQKLERLSVDSKHYESAFNKSLRRPHSEQEIRLHLRKRGADEAAINSIINRLLAKNYLNDARFVEYWCELRTKSHKSRSYIVSELRSKGVATEVINQNLPVFNDDGALRALIAAKSRRYPDQNKLKQYLLRKGFSYDAIQSAMKTED